MTTAAHAASLPADGPSFVAERPEDRVHRDGLVVLEPLGLPATVTLVDDVITWGAQFLGAAWAVWAARSEVESARFRRDEDGQRLRDAHGGGRARVRARRQGRSDELDRVVA